MRKRDPAILFAGFWAGVLLTTWCQNWALTHKLEPRTHKLQAPQPPSVRPRPPSGVFKVQQRASHAQSSDLQHFATSSLQPQSVALQIDSVEKQVSYRQEASPIAADSKPPSLSTTVNSVTQKDTLYGINSWWAVITHSTNAPSDRKANVAHLQRNGPFINIFEASWGGLDRSCTTFLKKHNIRVSPKYWHGEGNVEEGKIGHWCSFLRFLVECQSKPVDFCVSIEDDLKLDRYEIAKLNALLEFHSSPTPMERFGPGMDTLVVYDRKQVHLMIQDVKIQQIVNPVDNMFTQLGYYSRAAEEYGQLINDNSQETSLIRTMRQLDISEFNTVVDNTQHLAPIVATL